MRAICFRLPSLGVLFLVLSLSTVAGATAGSCPNIDKPMAPANAGCLIVENNQVLMLKQWNAKWALPEGTSEPEESAQCTAWRETWEETGLKVDVGELIHVYDNGFHLFNCVRQEGQSRLNANRPFTFEVLDVVWVRSTELEHLRWRFKSQRQVIENWLIRIQ